MAYVVWTAAGLMAVAACATLLRMWRWVETVVLSPRPAAARHPAVRRTVGVPPPPSGGRLLPPGPDGHVAGAQALHRAAGMYLAHCEAEAAEFKSRGRGFS